LWEQWAQRAQDASEEGERLQKILARVGYGSRRVCEELIADGRVTVNGEVAILGRRVNVDHDQVCVDDAPVGVLPGLVYYLLNKPDGVVTTSADTHGRPTVLELVPEEPRVFSVGRLDMETTGLIILTNDGQLAQHLTHPRHGVEKEYIAEVECGPKGVSSGAMRELREGVELDDGWTAPAQVGQPDRGVLRIVIHEGRNRQVRRMCEAVGHEVIRLARTRIGPLRDTSLPPGQYRELTFQEVRDLSESVELLPTDTISE
jgi:23S rRNA pseudouridine2605 synthase